MVGMPAKKVFVEARGGVGNQMFQYAAARALSLELDAELVIEERLGFLLDRRYGRTFELARFPITYRTSTLVESFPFFADRIRAYYDRRVGHKGVKRNSKNYLFERDFHFVDLSAIDADKNRYWLTGYYQDPRYFDSHKETILKELTPPVPMDPKYIELADLSKQNNLVALGIRMYEESSSPEVHARDRVVKTVDDYRLALAKLLKEVSNPLVLAFTSREFELLQSLDLPQRSIFVNPDRGFTDTIDTLWLMSKCQHHIFNNSTFYWWGAALSQMNYNPDEQKIIYSDNFLNPSIGYGNWRRF